MEEITPQSSFWRTPGRRGEAPGPRRSRDPFVARVGAIVLVGLLGIPVIGALSGGDDSGSQGGAAAQPVSPAGGDGSIALIDPNASTTTTLPPATEPAAPTTVQVTTAATAPATTAAKAPTTQAPPTTAAATVPATSGERAERAETLAAVETTTTAPQCSGTYEVGAGDYWIGIADRAGVSTGDLLAANQATTDTPLYPGATVCLPAGARDPGPPPTTTTKPPATTAKPTTTTTKPPTTTAQPTTTTDAPATTPAPTTTLPSRTYTRDEVIEIIASVFPPEELETALKIATRESNLQPGVRNWCCFGLFQIHWEAHRSWLAGIGVTSSAQLYDPLVNAQAAWALYQRAGGWGPWGGIPG